MPSNPNARPHEEFHPLPPPMAAARPQRHLPDRPSRAGPCPGSHRRQASAPRPPPAPSAIILWIQLGGDQGEEGLPSLAVGGAGVELESGGKQS